MMKNKKGIASILIVLAAVLAVVSIILYGSVMYKFTPVYFMLAGAAVVALAGFALAGKLPTLSGYFPICVSVLLASAAVWGSQLMVNQIGYVVAGLDGPETIMPWAYFLGVTVIAMVASIIAAFLPMVKAE